MSSLINTIVNRKIHEFKQGIYPRRLWVVCDCDPSALNDMFPEGGTDKKPFEVLDKSTYGCVDIVRRFKPDQKGGVLIRFDKKSSMTPSTIAHEAVHAALEMFSYCGCRVDIDNQEPFAYLVGWIADCCEQVRTGNFKD